MGSRDGGPKASGVVENPGGDRQGVRGGVELPRGTNTPRVEELPGGGGSGVIPEGNRVPREDERGQGRDGNSPATRDIEASGDDRRREEPAVPQIPHQGTAECRRG